jgi:putative pyruvate formate lyase activating enzyme
MKVKPSVAAAGRSGHGYNQALGCGGNEPLPEENEVKGLPFIERCFLCGRRCGIDRRGGKTGPCRAGLFPRVGAWVLHMGEEPPLCGTAGSGAVFFSGCSLRCVYCQNYRISQQLFGQEVSLAGLAGIMLELERNGAANIDLVSPTHYAPHIAAAIVRARDMGLGLPIVYNSHGFDTPEALDLLEGLVDVYVPDLRYSDETVAEKLSGVKGYCETARGAIERMFRQVGHLVVDPSTGLASRGLLVRLLVLPAGLAGVEESLLFLKERFGTRIAISLMAQYHPLYKASLHPPLDRTITPGEYEQAVDTAIELGFEEVFIQDLESTELGIPDFGSETPFQFDVGAAEKVDAMKMEEKGRCA